MVSYKSLFGKLATLAALAFSSVLTANAYASSGSCTAYLWQTCNTSRIEYNSTPAKFVAVIRTTDSVKADFFVKDHVGTTFFVKTGFSGSFTSPRFTVSQQGYIQGKVRNLSGASGSATITVNQVS
jgi:hypothetical protein